MIPLVLLLLCRVDFGCRARPTGVWHCCRLPFFSFHYFFLSLASTTGTAAKRRSNPSFPTYLLAAFAMFLTSSTTLLVLLHACFAGGLGLACSQSHYGLWLFHAIVIIIVIVIVIVEPW